MIEVWNKVDLLTEEARAMLPPESDNVIHLSALKGTGMRRLISKVETLGNKIMNKGTYKLRYPINEHYKRLNWLK